MRFPPDISLIFIWFLANFLTFLGFQASGHHNSNTTKHDETHLTSTRRSHKQKIISMQHALDEQQRNTFRAVGFRLPIIRCYWLHPATAEAIMQTTVCSMADLNANLTLHRHSRISSAECCVRNVTNNSTRSTTSKHEANRAHANTCTTHNAITNALSGKIFLHP